MRIIESIKEILHSPIVLLIKIKNGIFSLTKLWGIGIFIGLLLIMYYLSIYSMIYIKTTILIQGYNFEKNQKIIINKKKENILIINYINCQRNQIDRIINNKEVEIDYCTKEKFQN